MTNTKNYIHREEVSILIKNISLDTIQIELTDTLYISAPDANNLYTVGCTMEEKFFKIPDIGMKILSHIKKNKGLQNLDLKEEIDIQDFIKNLALMGLITKINEFQIEKNLPEIESKIGLKFNYSIFHKPFTGILFNKITFILMIIIFSLSLYCIYNQYVNYGISFIPKVEVLFSVPNLLVLLLILYISDIILGLYHETAHVLTARHFGLKNVNINLGRRLVHVVYQTRISNIWVLSKNQRRILYLSGMFADFLLISIIIIISQFFLYYELELLFFICRILILVLMLGILFELKVYMRTDIYYLISDKLDNPNLHQDSVKILKNFKLEWKKADSKLRCYFCLMVISSFIEVYVFLNFLLPFLIMSIKEIINIFDKYPSITANNWGTLLGFTLIIIELLLLIIIYIREKYVSKDNYIFTEK
ncbi:hypothetical protein HMPREF2767_02885 [Nosocomiicoccus sp. HMSC067E10]|uniref:hypothetical protein n=1 Tax=Nosocomiicoccus sp. HMSC067E10 TaxID=1739271 RepID=UPI0008A18C10|nr:hypothetical protein [Nosocomiicoccus sp. HMSC067E10]OFL47367.1 hypothetical protein HMPREF2767_02885 [Nosocomiicoccus sp. HMSC067E10]